MSEYPRPHCPTGCGCRSDLNKSIRWYNREGIPHWFCSKKCADLWEAVARLSDGTCARCGQIGLDPFREMQGHICAPHGQRSHRCWLEMPELEYGKFCADSIVRQSPTYSGYSR